MGVGIGMGGFLITIGMFDQAEVALELNPDGTFTHYNTWEDVGQGGDIGALSHAVKALAPLGVRPEQVKLVMNDSKTCPDTGLAAASRSHYMAGNATIDAANKLIEAMKKADGTYRTYDEMVKEGIPTKYIGHYDQFNIGLPPGLDPNTGHGEKNPAYMYGVNVALWRSMWPPARSRYSNTPASPTWASSATASPLKAKPTAAFPTASASPSARITTPRTSMATWLAAVSRRST